MGKSWGAGGPSSRPERSPRRAIIDSTLANCYHPFGLEQLNAFKHDPQEVIDHQGQYSQACRCKVKKSFPHRCSEVHVQRKYLSFSLPRKSYKQTPKTTNYRWNHVQKSSNLFDGCREPDTRECFPFVSTWLPEQSRTPPAPVSREWESKTRRQGRLSR
jgi:hypothetical protein